MQGAGERHQAIIDQPAARPVWLNKKINLKDLSKMQMLLAGLNLHTVCQSASCPNIGECFNKGEAAFMILGDICTRNCAFCGVKKGTPAAPDHEEPHRIADACLRLGLKHVVITSVTRDDLADGGADAFVSVVGALRDKIKGIKIELLIPDLKGSYKDIEKIVRAKPDVINHNIETVPRLYAKVRPKADYRLSLKVLEIIKEIDPACYTKSAILLGLGEKEAEILEAFSDLRFVGCDFLSMGQYLSPTKGHYPVKEYLTPQRFDYYREKAENHGFLHVLSGPYVRSSYCASDYLEF